MKYTLTQSHASSLKERLFILSISASDSQTGALFSECCNFPCQGEEDEVEGFNKHAAPSIPRTPPRLCVRERLTWRR